MSGISAREFANKFIANRLKKFVEEHEEAAEKTRDNLVFMDHGYEEWEDHFVDCIVRDKFDSDGLTSWVGQLSDAIAEDTRNDNRRLIDGDLSFLLNSTPCWTCGNRVVKRRSVVIQGLAYCPDCAISAQPVKPITI